MQVARVRMRFAVAILALTIATGTARADIRLDDPNVGYLFHFFSDVDGVNVYSHYATSGINFSNNAALSVQWGHDVVVFPAIDAPVGSAEAADAITTASRPISSPADAYRDFVKVRDEITASVNYGGASAAYYVSTESDYFAQMVTLGYTHGFFDDNTTLSSGIAYGWDDIKPLEDQDTQGTADYLRTLYANFIVTQVITPTTVARVGVEMNRVRGLQHDPYRNVYVGGGNVPEAHPSYRNRYDGFVRVSQYITNRSSIQGDYRYYTDDWGVDSQTFGVKLNQYVTDKVIVRYRYRYYTQIPAWFYRDEYFTPVDGYQTNDYRLGDYGANLFGGHLLWYPGGAYGGVGFMKRAHFEFSYEHYFNSNNFSANVYEAGIRVTL